MTVEVQRANMAWDMLSVMCWSGASSLTWGLERMISECVPTMCQAL